jgi:hypothetical protein
VCRKVCTVTGLLKPAAAQAERQAAAYSARRNAASRFHFNGGEGLISFQVAIFATFTWTLLNCRTSPCPPGHRPVTDHRHAQSPP